MSSAPAPAAAPGTPKKGKKKLLIIVVAVASLGGGAALPMVMGGQAKEGDEHAKKAKHAHKTVNVDFGDVTVNLAEERMNRYLRLKIVLLCESEITDEKEAAEHLAPVKPTLKNWLLSHLAGKSLKDVSGTHALNRLRREVLAKFEELMAPEDGDHGKSKKHLHLKDVLFTEYVVQ